MENYNKANVRLRDLDPGVFDSVYSFESNTGDSYDITFNDDGSIQNIESSNKRNYPFDLDAINNYWVDRGFELSHAIVATFKEKGDGDEDALGLGYYNESKTINETFQRHLGLLHKKLHLNEWGDAENDTISARLDNWLDQNSSGYNTSFLVNDIIVDLNIKKGTPEFEELVTAFKERGFELKGNEFVKIVKKGSGVSDKEVRDTANQYIKHFGKGSSSLEIAARDFISLSQGSGDSDIRSNFPNWSDENFKQLLDILYTDGGLKRSVNETFAKHLELLHERLGLVKEDQSFYKSYPDGTEIEVDNFTGRLMGFIYKGNEIDVADFKDLGWYDENKERINATLKDPAYRLSLKGTHEMVFYPEASGGPVYFSMDSNNYMKNTLNETFAKHLGLLKNKLNEGWNDDEDKMLNYLQRLADNDSDDFYDAMRDFKATYGYTPSVRRRSSSYSSRPSLTGKTLYFYNVPSDKQGEAYRLLKKTKTGKWYSLVPNPEADAIFGKGRPWTAK